MDSDSKKEEELTTISLETIADHNVTWLVGLSQLHMSQYLLSALAIKGLSSILSANGTTIFHTL